jgi:hypothetical protein
VTLDELDSLLPNGFHDMYIGSLELDYSTGTIKLNVDLLVGWPEDSESERNQYQKAIVTITGLCFCSIDPPYPGLTPCLRAEALYVLAEIRRKRITCRRFLTSCRISQKGSGAIGFSSTTGMRSFISLLETPKSLGWDQSPSTRSSTC